LAFFATENTLRAYIAAMPLEASHALGAQRNFRLRLVLVRR